MSLSSPARPALDYTDLPVRHNISCIRSTSLSLVSFRSISRRVLHGPHALTAARRAAPSIHLQPLSCSTLLLASKRHRAALHRLCKLLLWTAATAASRTLTSHHTRPPIIQVLTIRRPISKNQTFAIRNHRPTPQTMDTRSLHSSRSTMPSAMLLTSPTRLERSTLISLRKSQRK